jgi:hypothetical protein
MDVEISTQAKRLGQTRCNMKKRKKLQVLPLDYSLEKVYSTLAEKVVVIRSVHL